MTHDRAALLDRLARSGPFGFGGSSLGNLYRAIDEERAHATVYAAWADGVRYFDTAPFYGLGLGERRLGDVLRTRNRNDFILSTKVGRLLVPGEAAPEKFGFRSPMPFDPVFDYSYDGVMRSVEASLHRLGLARIDILYMHDLGRLTHRDNHDRHFRHAVDGGFRAMADLRDQGIVAAIGLGVNEVEICAEALPRADFDLFMIAGRYTLLDRSAGPFFDDCRRRGIGVVAAGVFNSGVLAAGIAKGVPRYDYEAAPDEVMRRVAAIERVCERFDVPLPAAALQFVKAHPAVTLTVVGTGRPARVSETVDLARRPIPDAFWMALQAEDPIAAGGAVSADMFA
ncbi:aldo/keto reductase [Sphingomonas oligophenolica]|uniref:Aldo/keto reductase n=1 Tax=Sphingomonas oligophenolica TaxID=301154 RepID=A0ABU9Y029_9SPHN